MKFKIIFVLMVSVFSFNTCDILRFSRFEVVSWSPGYGYHSEPERIAVTLDFSRSPDKASVERNFSLTGDGNRVKGNFSWSGNRMTFFPLPALEKNTGYAINLSADAHDNKGLNLDEAFIAFFSTRPDNTRPVLISYYPQMYEEVDDPKMEATLEFSIPVPLRTLYDNVSFSPAMTGNWRLENYGRLAVFSPSEPWTGNSRYEFRFSSSLTDNNGMNIGNDFLSVFTTGKDRESPSLVNAWRITKSGAVFELSSDIGYHGAGQLPVENFNWEKEDRLSLIFSRPVDSGTVRNNLSIEGGPGLFMETPPGFYTEIIFRFESNPVYESRFTFRIRPGIKDSAGNESKKEYIYRIFANGKHSKPPVLAGLRIPMIPDNNSEQNLKFFGTDSLYQIIPITNGNYPSGESVRTWIELYFACAEGASMDIFSVMELFRVETSNNVITFSPRQVKNSGFSIHNPHSGFEDFQRIEIGGNLVNSTNYGIVNFQVGAGLKDSLGNRNENVQRISLIK